MGKAKEVQVAGRKGPRSGFVKATFSLEPEQLLALQQESFRRAGGRRPDMSEAIRELVGSWLNRRGR